MKKCIFTLIFIDRERRPTGMVKVNLQDERKRDQHVQRCSFWSFLNNHLDRWQDKSKRESELLCSDWYPREPIDLSLEVLLTCLFRFDLYSLIYLFLFLQRCDLLPRVYNRSLVSSRTHLSWLPSKSCSVSEQMLFSTLTASSSSLSIGCSSSRRKVNSDSFLDRCSRCALLVNGIRRIYSAAGLMLICRKKVSKKLNKPAKYVLFPDDLAQTWMCVSSGWKKAVTHSMWPIPRCWNERSRPCTTFNKN